MARERLSVVLLTKNEAHQVARCLESVRWADEIIVVDDESSDRTPDICREYGAQVLTRRLDTFAQQATAGLAWATGDWVLTLDADEVVTPGLREQMQALLRRRSDCVGYTFKRLNYFLGHCMRHGGWHHNSLHLFRRTAGTLAGTVHYAPQLKGNIGHLDADMAHYPFRSLAQFVERQNRYTSLEAQEMLDTQGVLPQRVVRYNLTWRPVKLFWKSYVKKQGRREGWYGLVFAILYAWVHFLKWAKYWELVRQRYQPEPGAAAAASLPPQETTCAS